MKSRVLLTQNQRLTDKEITLMLQNLRNNSIVFSSHFAVAAIVEVKLKNGAYAYISGVNVENHHHNRLGIHGEQNAIAAAETLFGGNAEFTDVWVMGAPDSIHKGSDHVLAHNHVQPCGICRQILMSLSEKNSFVSSVTVDGKMGNKQSLASLLPNNFSERDLKTDTSTASTLFQSNPLTIYDPIFILDKAHIPDKDIYPYLKALKPHIVDRHFETSPIVSCIFKISVDDETHYIPGTLVQDIAFASTDAIFTALGIAGTQFGSRFKLDAVYLYADTLEISPTFTSPIENSVLAKYAKSDIPITVYNNAGNNKTYKLSDCISQKALADLAELIPVNVLNQLSNSDSDRRLT